MNRNTGVAAAAGTLALATSFAVAFAEESKEVVHVDSATANYAPINPDASRATLWGNPESGPHAAFTRIAAGANVPLHTHTSDLRIAVLKGAYVYKPEKGAEIRVTAGQYLFIPGGLRHGTGTDAKEGVVFYQEADGKFDLIVVK